MPLRRHGPRREHRCVGSLVGHWRLRGNAAAATALSAACPGAADPDDRSPLISAVYRDALARPMQACGATRGGLCCELNARLAVPGTVGQFQARGEAPVVDRPPQLDDRSASGAYDSRRRSTSAWAGFSDPRDAFSSRDLLRARRPCDALRSRVPRRTHPQGSPELRSTLNEVAQSSRRFAPPAERLLQDRLYPPATIDSDLSSGDEPGGVGAQE